MTQTVRIPCALGVERASARARTITLAPQKAELDATYLDDLERQIVHGTETVRLALQGAFDSGAAATYLAAYQGTSLPFAVGGVSDPAVGDPAFLGRLTLGNLDRKHEAGAVPELSFDDAPFDPGTFALGTIALLSYYDGGLSASGASAVVEVGPVAADQELRIALQVARPFAGDVTFDLRSDTASDFGDAPVSLWTPAAITEPAALFHTLPGPLDDPFFRFEYTVTSGTAYAFAVLAVV